MSAAYRAPTASGIGRASRCPASLVLPIAANPGDPSFARKGNALHRFMEVAYAEGGYVTGREKGLAAVREEFGEELAAEAALIPAHAFPQPGGEVEVAFALDVSNGGVQQIGARLGRAYPAAGPATIFGTADVVRTVEPGAGEVIDYKTGSDAYVTPPAENRQLLTLALMAARAYGWDTVTVELRYLKGEACWKVSATFDELDLDGHHSALRGLMECVAAEAQRTQHDVHEGEWCRYCPSYCVCPAKAQLAASLHREAAFPMLTDANVPEIWARLGEAEELIASVRKRLVEYVGDRQISLPDGRVMGKRWSERTTMDAEKLHAAMVKRWGYGTADKAVEWSTSKARLETALNGEVEKLKKAGEKITRKALVELVMSDLKAVDGLKSRRSEYVSIYTSAKAKLKAAAEKAEAAAAEAEVLMTAVSTAVEDVEIAKD